MNDLLEKELDITSGHRQRLRERFLKGGESALADYEMLEMVLFAAMPRADVKPLAKALIAHFESFANVVHAEAHELAAVKGLGQAGIAAIKLLDAATQRLLRDKASEMPVIQSWTALLDYCRLSMAHKKIEELRVLFLNQKHMLIADELQQTGTINHSIIYPREVVKRALELAAVSIILVHNHPSGDPTPSDDDIRMTKLIATALAGISVKLHDHLVIGKQGHFSFRSYGLLEA